MAAAFWARGVREAPPVVVVVVVGARTVVFFANPPPETAGVSGWLGGGLLPWFEAIVGGGIESLR